MEVNPINMKILLTGSTGLVGGYMCKEFSDSTIVTLGLDEDHDIPVDLSVDVPVISDNYDMVIHCSGSISDKDAMSVNYEGTCNLLKGLEGKAPKWLVYISSMSVYGLTSGEEIDETAPLRPITEYGRSKMLAEQEMQRWCDRNNVCLTILRPALTFGNGVNGKAKQMYDAIVGGWYFHVRGNTARRSVVMGDDIAKAARLTYMQGGVYNVSDGYNHTVIELGDAMAAHSRCNKRILHCPRALLKFAAKVGDLIAPLGAVLNSERLSILTSTMTFSNAKLREATGMQFYDTIEVVARRDTNYPYEYKD